MIEPARPPAAPPVSRPDALQVEGVRQLRLLPRLPLVPPLPRHLLRLHLGLAQPRRVLQLLRKRHLLQLWPPFQLERSTGAIYRAGILILYHHGAHPRPRLLRARASYPGTMLLLSKILTT